VNPPRRAEGPVLKRRAPRGAKRLPGTLLLRFADRAFGASLLKGPPLVCPPIFYTLWGDSIWNKNTGKRPTQSSQGSYWTADIPYKGVISTFFRRFRGGIYAQDRGFRRVGAVEPGIQTASTRRGKGFRFHGFQRISRLNAPDPSSTFADSPGTQGGFSIQTIPWP